MKISKAALHPYRLPLRSSWLTAAGGFGEREGWLLRLDSGCGARAASGYGDCAPLPESAAETPAAAASWLCAQARRLIGMQVDDALQAIGPAPGDAPAARLALETALLDLAAQAAESSLATYLRAKQKDVPAGPAPAALAVNAALGSIDRLADESVDSACRAGFRILKLKVGVAPIDHDIEQLRRIVALLPPGVQLRLDANRAWSGAAAEYFLRRCADLPIEMLEEPLAEPTLEQLRSLQGQTTIAIAIDESAERLDTLRILQDAPVRRLVIKPTRCGGLLAAFLLAQRALAAGLDCVVTSSVESACGVTAAAHLATAIGNQLAHGLATSEWLAADTGAPPTIVDGRLLLPHAAGLGFMPGKGIAFSPIADWPLEE